MKMDELCAGVYVMFEHTYIEWNENLWSSFKHEENFTIMDSFAILKLYTEIDWIYPHETWICKNGTIMNETYTYYLQVD